LLSSASAEIGAQARHDQQTSRPPECAQGRTILSCHAASRIASDETDGAGAALARAIVIGAQPASIGDIWIVARSARRAPAAWLRPLGRMPG
jgi:hypothetical protein